MFRNIHQYQFVKVVFSPCLSSKSQNGFNGVLPSYVGIAGAASRGNWVCPGNNCNTSGAKGTGSNAGVLAVNTFVQLRDITDGTSNTMMVSEISNFTYDTTGTPQDRRPGAGWCWSISSDSNSWNGSIDGGTDAWTNTILFPPNTVQASNQAGCANNTDQTRNTPLSSTHSGVHALLCDGSVRFLNSNVDMNILTYVAVRMDNQTITDF